MTATGLTDELTSSAEHNALPAEDLAAFSGFKLAHVKRELAKMLGLIGRHDIFAEYTKHDITHINKMLNLVEWMIPEDTKQRMSAADWLMLVLAIYFHDMGMLVTREEFSHRGESAFPAYKDARLRDPVGGVDLTAKLNQLPTEDKERYLYQEFVRSLHASRIRLWIAGRTHLPAGDCSQVVDQLNALLRPLPEPFRRDLGIVCESHHLNDLDNLQKYPLSRPYGDEAQAAVNIQYVAVLLRTVDLLHITKDRTPSVEFALIAPADPTSQREWAKQIGVASVRAKPTRPQNPGEPAAPPTDTIEIHAFFNDPVGFFGLTSYVAYARTEIQRSHEWVKATEPASHFRFPWSKIDDSQIEASGFINRKFEFTIDQEKILKLLTGHTIYDNTTVVVRELAQNAIDAIRFQRLIDKQSGLPPAGGRIDVSWDVDTRILKVTDDGTGISQGAVEQFLLRVGSSQYQDDDFRRKYPSFSSISRFGIGILSCFMIADEVEITTSHQADEEARKMVLRSVNGRYLIKLLDKHADPEAARLGVHGTTVSLRVRQSARLADVTATARRWLVLPECEVVVHDGKKEPERIGYVSLTDAVKRDVEALGLDLAKVRIEEETFGDFSIAYAMSWSSYFQEHQFLSIPRSDSKSGVRFGVCVEGIRVEGGTPGFLDGPFCATVNVRGVGAPKTNVARSALEDTAERSAMLQKVYNVYCQRLGREVADLYQKRGFSKTWAGGEAPYLISALENARPTDPAELESQIKRIPRVIVERHGGRYLISSEELANMPFFWTTECGFFRSAEMLLREASADFSISMLNNAMHDDKYRLAGEPLVIMPQFNDRLSAYITSDRAVTEIVANPDERRVDLLWSNEERANPYWLSLTPDEYSHVRRYLSRTFQSKRLWIGRVAVVTRGLGDATAVDTGGMFFILGGTPVATFLIHQMTRLGFGPDGAREPRASATVAMLLTCAMDYYRTGRTSRVRVEQALSNVEYSASEINVAAFCEAMTSTVTRVYDTSVWKRGAENIPSEYEEI